MKLSNSHSFSLGPRARHFSGPRYALCSLLRGLRSLPPLHVLLDARDILQGPPLGGCFPVEARRDSWSWRDFFTGDPLLVSLDQRVQSLQRLCAQRTRDLDRASRGDPPTWEDVTMNFAAKVLDLSCFPQGSRSHFEKLLHERHWTIGHNSCKKAQNSSRTECITDLYPLLLLRPPRRILLRSCRPPLSSPSPAPVSGLFKYSDEPIRA